MGWRGRWDVGCGEILCNLKWESFESVVGDACGTWEKEEGGGERDKLKRNEETGRGRRVRGAPGGRSTRSKVDGGRERVCSGQRKINGMPHQRR